jgi:hypothetical protein
MNAIRSLAVAACLLIASTVFAQESLNSYIEIMRSDLKTQKKVLITEAMKFTDDEGKVFWPMYREYELEMSKVQDNRIAILKDYAQNYETLNDKKTEELVTKSFDFQKDVISLREKYYKKAVKLIGIKRGALWAQVENQINNLVEAQISSQVPLLK